MNEWTEPKDELSFLDNLLFQFWPYVEASVGNTVKWQLAPLCVLQ